MEPIKISCVKQRIIMSEIDWLIEELFRDCPEPARGLGLLPNDDEKKIILSICDQYKRCIRLLNYKEIFSEERIRFTQLIIDRFVLLGLSLLIQIFASIHLFLSVHFYRNQGFVKVIQNFLEDKRSPTIFTLWGVGILEPFLGHTEICICLQITGLKVIHFLIPTVIVINIYIYIYIYKV